MRPIIALIALVLASLLTAPRVGAVPVSQPATSPADLRSVDARRLVEMLREEHLRWPAFRELRRRSEMGVSGLPEDDPGSELVICPQGTNEPPLYMVLFKFL